MENLLSETTADTPDKIPENADAEAEEEAEEVDEKGKKKTKSVADQLVYLCLKTGSILFHDQFETPYAKIPVQKHGEIWSLESEKFRTWLGRQYWAKKKRSVSATALNDAIMTLKGIARFDREKIPLHVRVAWHENAIWYDLSDAAWRAIRITPDGIEVVEDPPVLFRRWSQQAAQLVPDLNGSITQLLNFCGNLTNEKTKILLLVALVTCLVPDIPHIVFQFHGQKGSTKSTLARMIRDLVDPSTLKTLSFPSKHDDLVLTLKTRHFAFFDNISYISEEVSNLLCRAVTGDGVTRRKLYTDDEEIPAVIQCCIGLNGINLAANAPDLLERSILFEFEKMPKNLRRTEEVVWSDFAKARAGIVGGMFATLSKAMGILPTIKLDEKPRMADFAVWGCAIAEALGYGKEAFLDAYEENIGEQHRVVVQEHPVASAIQLLAASKAFDTVFDGKISDLLKELVSVAESESIDLKARSWPKAPQSLTRRIKEVKSDLEETGIKISLYRDERGSKVCIQKAPQGVVSSVIPTEQNDASEKNEVVDVAKQAADIFNIPFRNNPRFESLLKAKNDATDANAGLPAVSPTPQPDLPVPPAQNNDLPF